MPRSCWLNCATLEEASGVFVSDSWALLLHIDGTWYLY